MKIKEGDIIYCINTIPINMYFSSFDIIIGDKCRIEKIYNKDIISITNSKGERVVIFEYPIEYYFETVEARRKRFI